MTTKITLRVPIDIERLLTWALRDQGLGWDRPARGSSLDQMASLGTMISGGTIANPTAGLLSDEDAIVVRRAADLLPSDARALIIMHGRSGTRPEGADEPMPEPEQMRNRRGQLMWEYAIPGDRRSARSPRLDMLAWSAERDGVAFARAQWTAWREAMKALVPVLNPEMRHHLATGPEAPAAPWLMPVPVVHGIGAEEPPVALQPWLKSERQRNRLDHGQTVEELRAAARARVQARAGDWSVPERAPERRSAVEKPRVSRDGEKADDGAA